MKHKYSVMIAAVVLGLTVTLFAVEKQSGTSPAKLIRLKSNGETIAELRIPKGTSFTISGKTTHGYAEGGRITAVGDVTVHIRHAGSSPVVVKADEIEAVTDGQ
jgi:hypothetical protein